jgi:5-methyltetrahydrofolate--homocysteine methyltransferase
MVIDGDRDSIIATVKKAIESGIKPFDLINKHLIPGIEAVGEKFEKKEYFLPQLMLSAETMERAFEELQPLLQDEKKESAGKIIIATVKGDIHDIGKNIVSLMLKNYGFDVVDLGKDVACEVIIEKAQEESADIICLSALMTTTMTEMENVVAASRSAGHPFKIMIGGAVVTQGYADEIGADGYSYDAIGAVNLAKKLMAK